MGNTTSNKSDNCLRKESSIWKLKHRTYWIKEKEHCIATPVRTFTKNRMKLKNKIHIFRIIRHRSVRQKNIFSVAECVSLASHDSNERNVNTTNVVLVLCPFFLHTFIYISESQDSSDT